MGHATLHAQSAARRFGGDAQAYLPVQEFFDHTKSALADPRHRLILHHTLGIFHAQARFGQVIPVPGRADVPVRVLGERHVLEDFGRIPTVAQCFETLHPTALHTRRIDRDVPEWHARESAAALGGQAADHLPVHAFLNSAFACAAPHQARAVTHHTYGVHLCTVLFGPDIGGVSTAEIARHHLLADLDDLPDPDVMLSLNPPDWVSRATLDPLGYHG